MQTAEEMAAGAIERGLQYLAITDHSATHGFGDHVTEDHLRSRIEEIRALNETLDGFDLLIGTETNILPDGSPDYSDEVLAELDWVIASIHTSFNMTRKNMTERMVAAVQHPLVDALGHPTGRKIEKRHPYDVDMDKVIEAAAAAGTMIEINASPARRDLNDVHARAAAAGRSAHPRQLRRPLGERVRPPALRDRHRAPCLADRRRRGQHAAMEAVRQAPQTR